MIAVRRRDMFVVSWAMFMVKSEVMLSRWINLMDTHPPDGLCLTLYNQTYDAVAGIGLAYYMWGPRSY